MADLDHATLRFGIRTPWRELTTHVSGDEWVTVLGLNAAKKTSLIRVLAEVQPLTARRVNVAGRSPQRGHRGIGHVPQQRGFDRDLPRRGRDSSASMSTVTAGELCLTRFGGHLILAEGRRKESRDGTSVEVSGAVPA